MKSTIYQALVKTIKNAIPESAGYTVAYCGDTERDTLLWLSNYGGGLYRNVLHGFSFAVKAGEYK